MFMIKELITHHFKLPFFYVVSHILALSSLTFECWQVNRYCGEYRCGIHCAVQYITH